MERRAKVIWVALMILALAPGTVLLVFFSLPFDQALEYLVLVGLSGLTAETFAALSQPLRITGAALVALGLGLLSMPVRTRGWIKRVVQWVYRDRNHD